MSQCELLEDIKGDNNWISCVNEASATAVHIDEPNNKIAICMDCAKRLESESGYTITYAIDIESD